MRPVMTVIGSLILAGNLLLAVPVRQNTVVVRNAEQSEQELRKEMTRMLEARGIEGPSASHLVAEHTGMQNKSLVRAFTHMRLLFPELKHEMILADMAERILRQEPLAFDDYDRLIAMLHRLKGVKLTASDYERSRQCVLLNRYLG